MTHAEKLLLDSKKYAEQYAVEFTEMINDDIFAYGETRMNDEMSINILSLSYEMTLMADKHQITPKTFKEKAKSYFAIRTKLNDQYGINISAIFPFNDPSNLKTKIDSILINANFNDDQRRIIWLKLSGDKNSPDKPKTIKMIEQKENLKIVQNKLRVIDDT